MSSLARMTTDPTGGEGRLRVAREGLEREDIHTQCIYSLKTYWNMDGVEDGWVRMTDVPRQRVRLVWMKAGGVMESERQMTGRRVLGIGRRRVVVWCECGVRLSLSPLSPLSRRRVRFRRVGRRVGGRVRSVRASERTSARGRREGASERLSSSSPSPFSSRSRSPRPSVAVVVTSPWASDREANARRICALAGTFARDGCALAMSTEIDEKAATRIEEAGYMRRFQRSAREEAALGGKFGFRRARCARDLRRPREYYARKVSERRRRGCTRRRRAIETTGECG